jgi:hypothetical protein
VSIKVHPSRTDELAPARSPHTARHAAHAGASFAKVHAAELQRTSKATSSGGATAPGTDVTTPAPGTPTAPATADRVNAPVKLRKGESMSGVNGHPYAEVHGGARDGMYVNTSSNKRRGQAFVLVHRHGVEYHIYGSGKDRLVVALKPRKPDAAQPVKASTPPASTPTVSPTGSTGAPVGVRF